MFSYLSITPFSRKYIWNFESLMFSHGHAGLDITILGSNDFYSYRNQVSEPSIPNLISCPFL